MQLPLTPTIPSLFKKPPPSSEARQVLSEEEMNRLLGKERERMDSYSESMSFLEYLNALKEQPDLSEIDALRIKELIPVLRSNMVPSSTGP